MYCVACGQQLADTAAVCPSCGTSVAGSHPLARAASSVSSWAVASLALGVAGITALPLVGPILAIWFAGNADREIAEAGGTLSGKGFADAGRILGIVGLVLAGLFLLMLLFLLPMLGYLFSNFR